MIPPLLLTILHGVSLAAAASILLLLAWQAVKSRFPKREREQP